MKFISKNLHVPLLSPVSSHLLLPSMTVGEPAAGTTSAGPVGHSDVRSAAELNPRSSFLARHEPVAARDWSIKMLHASRNRARTSSPVAEPNAFDQPLIPVMDWFPKVVFSRSCLPSVQRPATRDQ